MRYTVSSVSISALLFFNLIATNATAEANPSDIAKTAVASFKPNNSIEKIEITKAEPRSYSYSIVFKAGQGTEARAKAETTRLISSTLQLLVKNGLNPSEDWVSAHAMASEPRVGETGKRLSKVYGSSHYNFALDRIEFKRATD